MGYDLDRFVGTIDKEFECPVCCGVFDNPRQTIKCQHTFCSTCIHEWIKQESNCPTCRQKLTTRGLLPVPRVLRNIIGKLNMKCDFASKGCLTVVRLEDLAAHVVDCDFNIIPCPKGCGFEAARSIVTTHDCVSYLAHLIEQRDKDIQSKEKEIVSLKQSLITKDQELKNLERSVAAKDDLIKKLQVTEDESLDGIEIKTEVDHLSSSSTAYGFTDGDDQKPVPSTSNSYAQDGTSTDEEAQEMNEEIAISPRAMLIGIQMCSCKKIFLEKHGLFVKFLRIFKPDGQHTCFRIRLPFRELEHVITAKNNEENKLLICIKPQAASLCKLIDNLTVIQRSITLEAHNEILIELKGSKSVPALSSDVPSNFESLLKLWSQRRDTLYPTISPCQYQTMDYVTLKSKFDDKFQMAKNLVEEARPIN